MFTKETLAQNQKLLLFILTGEQRGIAEDVRPIRTKTKTKVRVPVFISHTKPEVLQDPQRKTRTHPVNPYMNEKKVRARDPVFRTHSHIIHEVVATNGIRIMKNGQQTKSDGFRESPCHRKFRPGETPNVGPQPMKR